MRHYLTPSCDFFFSFLIKLDSLNFEKYSIIITGEIKMKYKIKNIPFIICICSVILLCLYISIGIYNKSKINENIFRLHVVANSNNLQDQIIKLKVADKIESYIKTLVNKQNINKKEVYSNIYNNIDNILTISNEELKSCNADYTSSIKIGKIKYEEKEDIYLDMDKGSYDSLQVLLGKAEGKNYWNLIFPNKDNIQNLKGLENILPGITDIYNDENLEETVQNKIYTFKILEIFKDFF